MLSVCHATLAAKQDGAVYNHPPPAYDCPFCRNVARDDAEFPLEVLYRDAEVFVKMKPKWWQWKPPWRRQQHVAPKAT